VALVLGLIRTNLAGFHHLAVVQACKGFGICSFWLSCGCQKYFLQKFDMRGLVSKRFNAMVERRMQPSN
jgi:hypothetical protein